MESRYYIAIIVFLIVHIFWQYSLVDYLSLSIHNLILDIEIGHHINWDIGI